MGGGSFFMWIILMVDGCHIPVYCSGSKDCARGVVPSRYWLDIDGDIVASRFGCDPPGPSIYRHLIIGNRFYQP